MEGHKSHERLPGDHRGKRFSGTTRQNSATIPLVKHDGGSVAMRGFLSGRDKETGLK